LQPPGDKFNKDYAYNVRYNYGLFQLALIACLNCTCIALHVPPCRTAGDKFNKEYAYNVRYNYGQEGKRQDWSEWSCVKIINQVRCEHVQTLAAVAAASVAAVASDQVELREDHQPGEATAMASYSQLLLLLLLHLTRWSCVEIINQVRQRQCLCLASCCCCCCCCI
jgi:hypothetical protein